MKRKEEKQRQRILQATVKVLRKKSYSDITMDEIADAMKGTKGILYYYFPSKASILYQLHLSILDTSYTSLKEVLEQDAPPLERLRRAIWVHTKTMMSNSELAKTVVRTVELENLPGRWKHRIRTLRRDYVRIFEGLIQDAVNADTIPADVDVQLMAFVILDAINSIPSWYQEDGRLSPDMIADTLTEFIIAGLGHSGSSTA